ncbi:hypothetical protein GALMADRAFT_138789 [Galerina marginata CBS 339.88]|uniref:Uncharacterized protein n=1 Tax=Galerina marginata (strain CBS 339.88) TaxID=685588 RepID=A0A067TFH0_GALM3|nr:hypothetical protein GALMADRAFT_138789 [Galerina marginata CBS 339.88]
MTDNRLYAEVFHPNIELTNHRARHRPQYHSSALSCGFALHDLRELAFVLLLAGPFTFTFTFKLHLRHPSLLSNSDFRTPTHDPSQQIRIQQLHHRMMIALRMSSSKGKH